MAIMTKQQKRQYLMTLQHLLKNLLRDYQSVVRLIETDLKTKPQNLDSKVELAKQADKVSALETMLRLFPEVFADDLRD
jgi:hypothetical protein